MKRRTTPNPKRVIVSVVDDAGMLESLEKWASSLRYGGNPEHKRNPGDYGLHPPSIPRQGKTLCDEVEIFTRQEALDVIRAGIRRGLVSVQQRNGWPQNVWSVAPNGRPVEAQLENSNTGTYHGYPMLTDDPLAAEVLRRWSESR